MKPRIFLPIIFLVTVHILFAGGPTMPLKIGDPAPAFALQSSNGDTVLLSDFAGKNYVVLVFYPGDQTPGCTKQLCAVRDDYSKFTAKNAVVFGVNPADIESHKKFIAKKRYQFPLLVDKDRETAKAYECAGALFIARTVFVIAPDGRIVYMKRGMPPDSEILAAIPEPAR